MSRGSVIIVICVALYSTENSAQRSGCSITFPIQDDRRQPIILQSNREGYEFVIPERGAISLRSGESIVLFCPHTRNTLEQSNTNLTSATCIRRDTLSVENRQYQFNNLRCLSPVKGSIELTNSRCGNNQGKIIDVGYQVTKNDWITLIQVCYDSNDGNALYAQHTIYGQAIEVASPQSYRPGFQDNGIAAGVSANAAYKQASQKKVFAKLLGSQSQANKYLYKNSFLSRGHLAPDADFLFAGLQFTTYFYINTCPQWEAVNAGNWLKIEKLVRKAAARYQKPLTVITGSHGILSLPDVNNNLKDIYLAAHEKLSVPKFLWKVAYLDNSKEGIAFVAINNPFIEEISENDLLCPNICNDYGWHSSQWSNVKKGFVYCCDVRVLQKVIDTMPKFKINGILSA